MKKALLALFILGFALWGATSGHVQWLQILVSNRHGAGAYGQSSDGTHTTGNLPKYASDGTLIDSGIAALGGGGSGSVTSVATAGPIVGGTITTSGTISCPTCSTTIAAGIADLGTSSIASVACASAVTVSAPGVIPGFNYTDLVIGSTTTQLTSAGHPFLAAYTGAYITITGGSGFTAGSYRIVSVSGSTGTMDRSVGTAASTGGIGTLVGDTIAFSPNASIKALTGYTPSVAGGLTIAPYPTVDNVNFDVCNWSTTTLTPSAVRLNWSVQR